MYATVPQLTDRNPSLAEHDQTDLELALTEASRWIDGYCARKFWLDPTATDRVFKASTPYLLDLGAHEIGAATVTVKTDDGTGTFATPVAASAYQLEPVNAVYSPLGAAPYTTLRAVSTSWPVSYVSSGRQDLVKITARYGWPAVPAVVTQVCLVLTVDGFENPSGVRSESIDGYSVSYGAVGETGVYSTPAEKVAMAKLGRYRRRWAA